jgi:hypothetical protein
MDSIASHEAVGPRTKRAMDGTTFVRLVASAAAVLCLCAGTGVWAQQKQQVSYKVDAESTKYPQRHTIDVGDEPGHTVGIFEIHRTFAANAPVVNGLKLKETWTRGYSDYMQSNGLSTNYQTFVAENGDRFYAVSHTMGQADEAGKRSTLSVGQITGGTGKFAGMRGLVRAQGASDGKRGFNETQAEIEYWFVTQ